MPVKRRKKSARTSIAPAKLDDIFPEEMANPDENNLNREWARQPKTTYQVGIMLAHARRRRDRAYTETKMILADVYNEIRLSPEKHKLPAKPTEAMVNNTALSSRDYRTAYKIFLSAQERHDVLLGALEALKQRCKALENLVRLHAMNYYGEPREGDIDQKTIDDLKKKDARKPLRRRRSNG